MGTQLVFCYNDRPFILGYAFYLLLLLQAGQLWSAASYYTRELASPLQLQDGDHVLVTLSYTSDFLNGAETIPINWNRDCSNCIEIDMLIPHAHSNCQDYLSSSDTLSSQCIANYHVWNQARLEMPECFPPSVTPRIRIILDEFDSCASKYLQSSLVILVKPVFSNVFVHPMVLWVTRPGLT